MKGSSRLRRLRKTLGPVFKFARRKADNDYGYGYGYVDDPVFVCVPS